MPALRRDDVTREIDLIEEVARIDGLERLPATLPARRGAAGRLTHAQRVRRAAEDAMVGRGLHEIVGWSFTDPELLDRLRCRADHALRRVVTLENPLSDAQSIMRPTLLGSLLDAARHNASRNGPDIAIFESGTVYRASESSAAPGELPADEHHALGVLLSGALAPRSWRGETREADFFAAKALLEALLERFGIDWSVQADTWPFLHPGRSAAVLASPGRLGARGATVPPARPPRLPRRAAPARRRRVGPAAHSRLRDRPRQARRARLAARRLHARSARSRRCARTSRSRCPTRSPPRRCSRACAPPPARCSSDARVFDVYSGEQVGEGRRSLALALSFRALERTLTDEDIAPVRAQIVAALEQLGGELRG